MQQNRPYSASIGNARIYCFEILADIFNNLHGTVGKTAVTKALQSLSDRGEVVSKAYGKQLVYVISQINLPTPSNEELEQFDRELARVKEQLAVERETTKTLQSTLDGLVNSLTAEEMTKRARRLREENERLSGKLKELQSGGRKVDAIEKAALDKEHERLTKLTKTRKKLV